MIGCTACGAVDPTLELGSLVVFDDLHFLSNRLPDGSLCTFFAEPGDRLRGHWILHGGPFSEELRRALLDGAAAAPGTPRATGARTATSTVLGSTHRPRSPSSPAAASSPSARRRDPETVLCGELELPFALIGFVTDYANEVKPGETDARRRC